MNHKAGKVSWFFCWNLIIWALKSREYSQAGFKEIGQKKGSKKFDGWEGLLFLAGEMSHGKHEKECE